ncbi:MAG: peptidylprolyl isomerase, partial [Eubacteriales bacterium]
MSASKHKRQRKTENPEVLLDKKATELAAKKEVKKYTTLAIVTIVLLVVIGSVVGFFSSTIPQNTFTAVTVGDHALTPAQFSYYYKDAYLNYSSTYGDYISMILDTESPLDEQMYDDTTGETWADFFVSQAVTNAAATYELYDLAMAAGYTLPTDEADYITSTVESVEYIATMYGLTSGDAYLTQTYGRGASVEGYKEYMTISSTAFGYAQLVESNFSYDADTLTAAYLADPNAYDQVDYKIYYVSVDTGETNEDGTIIADMDAGLALAEEMAAASYQNISEFDRYAVELATTDSKAEMYSDPSYTLRTNTAIGDSNAALTDWLADDARQEGDTTVIQADDIAYYVAYYIGRPDMQQVLPSVRDIFISATADETNTEDPTGLIAAKTTVDTVLASYEAGEDFGTLASNYSSDANTYGNEGLYECYIPGTLAGIDESWLFDASRQAGDLTTIETDSGYYIFLYEGAG